MSYYWVGHILHCYGAGYWNGTVFSSSRNRFDASSEDCRIHIFWLHSQDQIFIFQHEKHVLSCRLILFNVYKMYSLAVPNAANAASRNSEPRTCDSRPSLLWQNLEATLKRSTPPISLQCLEHQAPQGCLSACATQPRAHREGVNCSS